MRQEQQNMPWVDINKEPEDHQTKHLTFGQAIDALKQGALISRQGKNGHIYLQKGKIDYNSFDTIALKEVIGVPYHLFEIGDAGILTSMPCLIVDTDGLLNIFTPTTDDVLAEDWVIR